MSSRLTKESIPQLGFYMYAPEISPDHPDNDPFKFST